ncbi:MAG: bis(5'-nucleosyl)-tetraphosphatase (symmetrical) YqeK [Dehalococcoidia bacterium]|jgi:predicted HD superfamily hydrolase involved in NAD metabolism|nr:bis(5'-nucleosyl)-tetraphosphatase (symmetrical) YqeK [Dehalococcoidia bacterium]|tara:strand:- start:159 stop:767 length:609 start_codon:yes stop_codon:yes gene_type:complete
MDELVHQIQKMVDTLPSGLQAHVYRVRDIARELADRHGLDQDRAALGMLAHDVARAMPEAELTRRATEMGLSIGTVEREVPLLLHGPVGAEILTRESGLDDPGLYRAVYWHTTAHPSLDGLGKVVFLADKLDPEKITRYPYLPELRRMALENLDRAMLKFLGREISSMVSQGQMVHPAMIETRNHLLAAGDASIHRAEHLNN